MVEGLLVAMTAGTFLYVGTTEIIPESFEDDVPHREKWKRFAAFVGGIGSIMLIGGDEHDHAHH
jgi:zinc transporter 1/2/3